MKRYLIKWLPAVWIFGMFAISPLNAVAKIDIAVNGLFANKAMLTINGTSRLLKVGETSPEGVTLIKSDSHSAVVSFNGEQSELKLSQQISASFKAAKATEVRIPRGPAGHYFVGGAINGRHIQLMVDTGATVVSMNSVIAKQLGIDLHNAQLGSASTAGGVVTAHFLDVPSITIGSITLPFVRVAVLEGNFPEQILLGNSFLSRVEMREEKGVLILKKNH